MLVYRPRHELDCTPARFWALYFEDEFQNHMFVDGLGWSKPEITVVRDDADELRRDMTANPRVDLPGPIARLVKHTLGYTEEGRFDRKQQVFHMSHRTNIFGERVRLGGKFWLEPVGEHRCRRLGELTVDADIFGVGGLLERAVELNMKKGWDKSATFIDRWVAKHPDAG